MGIGSAMIYIFAFGPEYFKLGYAKRCPYQRKSQGFWHNQHPDALCHKLDQCQLLHLWEGPQKLEEALHAALAPDCGEFYLVARLEEVVSFLANVLEPLPLPEDPGLLPWPPKKKPCCGRKRDGFERADHAARSFVTKGQTAPCDRCGRVVNVRKDKLKEHHKSAVCIKGSGK